ncbi:bis(5'-nucleosyl)-tetraphosphatase PrpE [Metabacillus sp. GX 13764]|uniref:bis(5'-nucleosyl)-tetraphosphatase PrpE n=1 Tax=Metabacillus kandeliae TaxID=2900151 RepID=UPI001E4D05F2|nr:bis(5'-nucleosyl)-tetraphosphatase PrpE [Metabacillus kandeliae]
MKIDIIGDIHGCYKEFEKLTEKLGYSWKTGIPVHPEGRLLSFLGDLTDRGPDSLKVIETAAKLVNEKKAFYSPGNHCNKLYRYFKGNKVQITHGLETTVKEYEESTPKLRKQIKQQFMNLYEKSPLYQIHDSGKLIVAHAGIRQQDIGKEGKKITEFVLYGDITGKTLENGRPERRDWAKHYKGEPWIIYGHTPVKEPRIVNRTANIDTGAVFGGELTAFRYPEMETVGVGSSMPYDGSRFGV